MKKKNEQNQEEDDESRGAKKKKRIPSFGNKSPSIKNGSLVCECTSVGAHCHRYGGQADSQNGGDGRLWNVVLLSVFVFFRFRGKRNDHEIRS